MQEPSQRRAGATTAAGTVSGGKRQRAHSREWSSAYAVVGSQRARVSQYSGQQGREVSSPGVPKGLVGESPRTMVAIDGVWCEALLDTGSQVTCVSYEFYTLHLTHRQLRPLSDLDLSGAGGYNVPYLGYIEVDLTPRAKEAGTRKKVRTLALILADSQSQRSDDTPLLIGTNTRLLQLLLQDCRRRGGRRFARKLKVSKTWAAAYSLAASRARGGKDGRLGPLRLTQPTELSPDQTKEVTCSTTNPLGRDAVILVESHPSLPVSLTVEPCLTPSPS